MEYLPQFNKLIERISSETKVELPAGYKYRYAPRSCWKCAKDILIFKWCNSMLEGEIEKPPEPVPHTIQIRHTAMSGEDYWANTCPYCNSVQGDFYISNEPDSPLFILGGIEDDPKSFESDMLRISEYFYTTLS
jgi:hypothetical protein